jgi:hypothetical protein
MPCKTGKVCASAAHINRDCRSNILLRIKWPPNAHTVHIGNPDSRTPEPGTRGPEPKKPYSPSLRILAMSSSAVTNHKERGW